MPRQHKSRVFGSLLNLTDAKLPTYEQSYDARFLEQTKQLHLNMFFITFAWGQLKYILICCCLHANLDFIHISWSARSAAKQSTINIQVCLKSLTVFLRIWSKIRLSRFVSGMISAWSTDAQINISNFNMFFINRSTLAMTTNNNNSRGDLFLHRSLTDELHGEEKHWMEETNSLSCVMVFIKSFFLSPTSLLQRCWRVNWLDGNDRNSKLHIFL